MTKETARIVAEVRGPSSLKIAQTVENTLFNDKCTHETTELIIRHVMNLDDNGQKNGYFGVIECASTYHYETSARTQYTALNFTAEQAREIARHFDAVAREIDVRNRVAYTERSRHAG